MFINVCHIFIEKDTFFKIKKNEPMQNQPNWFQCFKRQGVVSREARHKPRKTGRKSYGSTVRISHVS